MGWALPRGSRALASAALIASLLQAGYCMALPFFLAAIVDGGVIGGNAGRLHRSLGGLAGAFTVFGLANLLQEQAAARVAVPASTALRDRLTGNLLTAPGPVTRIGAEIDLVTAALVRAAPLLLQQAALLLGSAILMAVIEWRLALITLLIVTSARLFKRTRIAAVFAQTAAVALGGWLTYQGAITPGLLIAFILLLANVIGAIGPFLQARIAVKRGRDAMSGIDGLLRQHGGVPDRPGAVPLPSFQGSISFEHVSLTHDGVAVLTDVSFTVQAGEHVCLVGAAGSEASFILALLVRLNEPTEGAILLDGTPLSQITAASLRAAVTFVPQTPMLLEGTIGENILMARPDATPADMRQAAKQAALDEAVAALPGGYDTRVEEDGAMLPAGVRQRIAIARALLRATPILLLDDAISGLDPASEQIINTTAADRSAGRTVFAVTHSLAAAASFDRALVFEGGRLVQDGPHGRLLGEPGRYAQLWSKTGQLPVQTRDGIAPEWLRTIPFLAGCRTEVLQSIAALFLSYELPQGRDVFRQGDPGEQFFVLVRGIVDVLVDRAPDGPRRVAVLRDGDFFGEIALLTERPRNATVRTLTGCSFLTLHRAPFLKLLGQEPEARSLVEAAMAHRLTRTVGSRAA